MMDGGEIACGKPSLFFPQLEIEMKTEGREKKWHQDHWKTAERRLDYPTPASL